MGAASGQSNFLRARRERLLRGYTGCSRLMRTVCDDLNGIWIKLVGDCSRGSLQYGRNVVLSSEM